MERFSENLGRSVKNLAIGCGVFAVIGCCLLCGGVFWFLREEPILDSTLSMPAVVSIDSEFEMVVTATNREQVPIVLDSIDIYDSFLDGVQVVNIDPEPSDTMHLFFMRSWEFGNELAPGESLEVRFTFLAVKEGHFSGDVDVCNPNQDFSTEIADVVVRNHAPTE